MGFLGSDKTQRLGKDSLIKSAKFSTFWRTLNISGVADEREQEMLSRPCKAFSKRALRILLEHAWRVKQLHVCVCIST